MSDHPVSFGDRVRIRPSALTEELGPAQSIGIVYGETTPSATGSRSSRESDEDLALNVFFEDRDEGFWFAPDLVEFVDYAPGSEITLKCVPDKRWVRTATSEWQETVSKQKPGGSFGDNRAFRVNQEEQK